MGSDDGFQMMMMDAAISLNYTDSSDYLMANWTGSPTGDVSVGWDDVDDLSVTNEEQASIDPIVWLANFTDLTTLRPTILSNGSSSGTDFSIWEVGKVRIPLYRYFIGILYSA